MDIGINLSINGSNVIGSTGLTPPLDDYTGAQTAYSVARKLRTAYAGDAIRVRRSSDNLELDIGYDVDGNLDESALTTHCGIGHGYIVKLYDNSGNGNDWVQTVSADQPRIVLSGVVDKINGKPTAISDAAGDTMNLTITGVNPSTIFVVAKNTRDTTVLLGSASGTEYFGLSDDATSNSYNTVGTPSMFVNSASIGASRVNFKTATINIQAVIAVTNLDLSSWALYKTRGAYYRAKTNLQECIIYGSDKSSDRAAIEANINEYYSIY